MRPESFAQALDWIAWYVECLENVKDGVAVRGLAEAGAGYERAMEWLRARTNG
jgi:hypothetical protein